MRDITQLHPRLQQIIGELQPLWAAAGLNVGIGECLRTVEEQDALYAQGRTTPGPIVTNARGVDYMSQHQWGIAFDFFQNDPSNPYPDPETSTFWTDAAAIAKARGLAWGGDWTDIIDRPHLYLPDWGDTPIPLRAIYGTPENFFASWNSTYYVWMGWIPNESIYDYLSPAGLSVNGDQGRAYGMYQYDYRYGLVSFMQSCVDYDPVYYAGFNDYISLGAGNTALVANAGLIALFQRYAQERTAEFQMLQDTQAVNDYFLPAVNAVSWDILGQNDPYILGSLFSMSIRSGAQTAAGFFPSDFGGNWQAIIDHAYDAQGQLYYDDGRWITGTGISQYDKVVNQHASGANCFFVPYQGITPGIISLRCKIQKLKAWTLKVRYKR